MASIMEPEYIEGTITGKVIFGGFLLAGLVFIWLPEVITISKSVGLTIYYVFYGFLTLVGISVSKKIITECRWPPKDFPVPFRTKVTSYNKWVIYCIITIFFMCMISAFLLPII